MTATITVDTIAATGTRTIDRLRARVAGDVLTADQIGYATAGRPFNASIAHTPDLIVVPASTADVITAVRFAVAEGLPVAVQATGHGIAGAVTAGLLIDVSRLDGVRIDPDRRVARVGAGTRWGAVVAAAAEYGLAPLNGSSPTVGVVGYTLGGGTSWLGRRYGFAADRVTRAEVVTAAGELVFADAETNADLFRALRGEGGSLGVVVALEFGLVPVADVFAGMVIYPIRAADRVLPAFAEWSAANPAEPTSAVALMRFPPAPVVPEPLRGREVVVVRGCWCGDMARGEGRMAAIRTLAEPIIDSFGPMPWTASASISADPADPMPHRMSTLLLERLTPDAITSLLAVAGPGAETALLSVEIRHIAGAADHADPSTAIANRAAAGYVLFTVGIPFVPEMDAAVLGSQAALAAAMAPHTVPGVWLNFVGHGQGQDTVRAAWPEETYARLAAVRAAWDPTGRFAAGGMFAAHR